MAPKIKNIIIFLAIGVVFVLIYIYFIKQPPTTDTLVSSLPDSLAQNTETTENNPSVTQDFLSLLLSVKSIKLDDTIFSDNAFINLRDSSIILVPDGNEGRVNPFAPLGSDIVVVSTDVPENIPPPISF